MSTFLFYIEPFPIRGGLTNFMNVLDNFESSLFSNCKDIYYIYGNIETLQILENKNKEYGKHFILPEPKETILFSSHLVDWEKEGIYLWKELMRPSELSNAYVQVIKAVHSRQPFDYIVCWGTNYAVKQAAKDLEIGFIDMELGCSRPPFMDSLVADPWGVNGSSALSKAHIFDLEFLEPSVAELDVLTCSEFQSDAYESQFEYMTGSPILDLVGKEKVAFIALQLYDDANLQVYSPYDSVKAVMEEILPKLKDAGYQCIIKEHPASAIRLGSEYANLAAKMYALDFDNVVWITADDKGVSNSKLYEIASLVITVNSSSGFEALFFDKPVVVLGDAVYKLEGCFPTLDQYLFGDFEMEEYRRNIGKIRRFFLEDYLIPREKAQVSRWFFNMLQFVGDMSKEDLTTGEIIRRYHERSRQLKLQ